MPIPVIPIQPLLSIKSLTIITVTILISFTILIVIIGNLTVIISVCTEKVLKTKSCWFIASLAFADFFIGLVIMPFSLIKELMGYWIFGVFWCDVHSALDVLLCTASILNLCLIALDRYWLITQPINYGIWLSKVRAFAMIFCVWVLSAFISIPPLLGWKVTRPLEEFPKCEVRFFLCVNISQFTV